MVATLARTLLAALLLVAVCWLGAHGWLADWAHMRFLPKLGGLLATILAAAAVFAGAALLLRIDDVDELAAAVRRRLARGRGLRD
jgi:peptidoglycan biosynthesis protein MviN/MurJ (putative lipid II flippase)